MLELELEVALELDPEVALGAAEPPLELELEVALELDPEVALGAAEPLLELELEVALGAAEPSAAVSLLRS